MRTIARCFLLFGLVAAVPRVAAAQAILAGEVKDTTGAVLPGVTVEAASPALIEKVRTAVTDSSGRYRIEALPPGSYAVTFSLRVGAESLISNETLVVTRSYTYDETEVLAKSSEEQILRDALAADLARRVMQRIQSLGATAALPPR